MDVAEKEVAQGERAKSLFAEIARLNAPAEERAMLQDKLWRAYGIAAEYCEKSGNLIALGHSLRACEILGQALMRRPVEQAIFSAALLHHVEHIEALLGEDPEFSREVELVHGVFLAREEELTIQKLLGLLREEYLEAGSERADGGLNLRELQVSSWRFFRLMVGDPALVLLKLASALDMFRTIAEPGSGSGLASGRPAWVAEFIDAKRVFFIPLAHFLKLDDLIAEIEDLALKIVDPVGYREMERRFGGSFAERQQRVRAMIRQLGEDIKNQLGISAVVQGRSKRLWSISKKIRKGVPAEEIKDELALRIIVDVPEQCYRVMEFCYGYRSWKPAVGAFFKDYIARPKPNGYQSLHLVVRDEALQKNIEVQIRTRVMHRKAEDGEAAHWKYKLLKGTRQPAVQQVTVGSLEVGEAVRRPWNMSFDWLFKWASFFDENVIAFARLTEGEGKSRRRILTLPTGSTAINVAYALSSGEGCLPIAVQVNGEPEHYSYRLCAGDRVEVSRDLVTSAAPDPTWLLCVMGEETRTQIYERYFKDLKYEQEMYEIGRQLVEEEIQAWGVNLFEESDEAKDLVMKEMNGQTDPNVLYFELASRGGRERARRIRNYLIKRSVDNYTAHRLLREEGIKLGVDLEADGEGCWFNRLHFFERENLFLQVVAHGRNFARQRLKTMVEAGRLSVPPAEQWLRYENGHEPGLLYSTLALQITGKNLPSKVAMARCCCPIHGDEIVARMGSFGEEGLGAYAMIHNAACLVLPRLPKTHLEYDVGWPSRATGKFLRAKIDVLALDRVGLLNDLTEEFRRLNLNVWGLNEKKQRNITLLSLVLSIPSCERLLVLLERVAEKPGVFLARRLIAP